MRRGRDAGDWALAPRTVSPSEPWGLRAARPAGDVREAAPSRNRRGPGLHRL